MKKLILVAISLLSISGLAQSNYEVISTGSKYSAQQIQNALDAANLCGFHYQNQQRQLLFDDGSIVHLKSNSETTGLGVDCFIQPSTAHENEYWEISSNGHLIRRKPTLGK